MNELVFVSITFTANAQLNEFQSYIKMMRLVARFNVLRK